MTMMNIKPNKIAKVRGSDFSLIMTKASNLSTNKDFSLLSALSMSSSMAFLSLNLLRLDFLAV